MRKEIDKRMRLIMRIGLLSFLLLLFSPIHAQTELPSESFYNESIEMSTRAKEIPGGPGTGTGEEGPNNPNSVPAGKGEIPLLIISLGYAVFAILRRVREDKIGLDK